MRLSPTVYRDPEFETSDSWMKITMYLPAEGVKSKLNPRL